MTAQTIRVEPGGATWGVWRTIRAYLYTFVTLRPNARRLLLGNMCVQTGIGVSGVLFNLYLVALGHGIGFIGLVGALSPVAQAAVAPLIGWAYQRIGARVILASGAGMLALSTALSAVLTNDVALIAIVLLSGVGFAAATIPASPYMIAHATQRQRAHLFSAYFASNTVGTMVGSLFSSMAPALALLVLGVHAGGMVSADRIGLLVGAAVMVAAVWLFWSLRAEAPPIETVERPVAPLSEDVAAPTPSLSGDVMVMLIATAVIAVTMGATIPFFNVYFAARLHASTAAIGVIYALSGLVCAVAAVLAPIAGRRGRVWGFSAARVLTAPVFVLFCLHPGLALAAVSYIARNTIGTVSGALENVFAMEVMPGHLRSSVAGWRAFVFNGGWALGSLAAGAVVARLGYGAVFMAAGAITFGGSVFYYARFARCDRAGGADRR